MWQESFSMKGPYQTRYQAILKGMYLFMFGRVYSNCSIAISFVILSAFIAQLLVAIPIAHAQPTTHAQFAGHPNLPQGCTNDSKTDYPGAIDCILNPNIFSCTIDPQFPGKCAYNCKLVP